MILVMLFMTLVCMGVLIYRLSVLQITGGQEYQQRAVAQQMRSVSIKSAGIYPCENVSLG